MLNFVLFPHELLLWVRSSSSLELVDIQASTNCLVGDVNLFILLCVTHRSWTAHLQTRIACVCCDLPTEFGQPRCLSDKQVWRHVCVSVDIQHLSVGFHERFLPHEQMIKGSPAIQMWSPDSLSRCVLYVWQQYDCRVKNQNPSEITGSVSNFNWWKGWMNDILLWLAGDYL